MNPVVCFDFHGELYKWSYTVDMIEEFLWTTRPYHECVIHMSEPKRWFVIRRLKGQVLHEDITNHWRQCASHRHAVFLLEELVIHLKICMYFLSRFSVAP